MNYYLFFLVTLIAVLIGSATLIKDDDRFAFPKIFAITLGGLFNFGTFGLVFPNTGLELILGWVPTALAFLIGYYMRIKLRKILEKSHKKIKYNNHTLEKEKNTKDG